MLATALPLGLGNQPAAAGDQVLAGLLTARQVRALRESLAGRILALSFGAGVDSTAMLVALRAAGLRPEVISFADTGGEKPATLAHVDRIDLVLRSWGWPEVTVVRHRTMPSTPYEDLLGNCEANHTLPSLAYGRGACSLKWKARPQDLLLKGASKGPNACPSHPAWLSAQARGQRVVRLIGYDCGLADIRRSQGLRATDGVVDFVYPLQLLGWQRRDCVDAIARALGADMVPIKSACFFCPASKAWELFWLAAEHPELFERALQLEWRAMTGRHSRFDEQAFGASWETMVRQAERFTSTQACIGLGRSFSWNHWARVQGVVDGEFRVRRDRHAEFAAMASALLGADNALDVRAGSGRRYVPILPAQQLALVID